MYLISILVLCLAQSRVASPIPFLSPGNGWTNPTVEPEQIGLGTAKVIARWDVVPFQAIQDRTMTLGVVAFHIAGIKRVAFSVENGPWVNSTETSLNPETGVWEYCVKISTDRFSSDGPIEVRAIAYPKSAAPQANGSGAYPGGGYPRLLDSLFLYVDVEPVQTPNVVYADAVNGSDGNSGTLASPVKSVWRAGQIADINGGVTDANGAIVYLKPGSYTWDRPGGGPVPVTTNRWLTIQAAPGVAQSAVTFSVTGWYPGIGVNQVCLKGVTVYVSLQPDDDSYIWCDNVNFIGPGANIDMPGAAFTGGYTKPFWTNCSVSNSRFGLPTGGIIRNCTSSVTMLGAGDPELLVNTTITGVAQWNLNYHPDVFAWNYLQTYPVENAIIYGVTAIGNSAPGLFWKDTDTMKDIALVNLLVNGDSEWGSGGSDTLNHFLMLNVTHEGSFTFYRPASDLTNISIRGSAFWALSIASGAGINNQWFDATHVRESGWNGYLLPGTNVTTGPQIWGSDYDPDFGSPLLLRLGTALTKQDLLGNLRTLPTSIGAIE